MKKRKSHGQALEDDDEMYANDAHGDKSRQEMGKSLHSCLLCRGAEEPTLTVLKSSVLRYPRDAQDRQCPGRRRNLRESLKVIPPFRLTLSINPHDANSRFQVL